MNGKQTDFSGATVLPDEDVFATALSRLLRASLLTRRRGREQAGEPVEIHPLVADAALRLLAVPAEERAETLGNQLLGLVDTASDILTHDRALADAMRQALHFALRLQSQTGVRLALRLGHFHSTRGLYALARVADEQALALARRVLGERHPDTLTSMGNLASALRAQGDLAGARTLQEQVLAAYRERLGERHPRTTVSAWNLFITLSHLNAAEEAKRVRDDHLVWLRNAAVESLDEQQRQIRDWLQIPMFLLSLSLRSRGRADSDRRSWLSRVAGWLRR